LPVPHTGFTVTLPEEDSTHQFIVPHPVLEMAKEVDPAVFGKLKELVETVRMGVVPAA
jgi:hypothetical protein